MFSEYESVLEKLENCEFEIIARSKYRRMFSFDLFSVYVTSNAVIVKKQTGMLPKQFQMGFIKFPGKKCLH